MEPTVKIWNDSLLVEYIDKDGNDTSFVVKDLEDIQELKKELESIQK